MKILHKIKRFQQTTNINCGPFALAELLSFYGDNQSALEIEKKLEMIENLGVDGSYLGAIALKNGYNVRITPQDLYIFDPQWFKLSKIALIDRLRAFCDTVEDKYLKISINGFILFLEAGGLLEFNPLSKELIINKLKKYPVLIGFCVTYLYDDARPNDYAIKYRYNHFAVVNGYDSENDKFSIVDPYHTIPFSKSGRYQVKSDKLIAAMYLAEANNECTVMEIWK